MHHRKKIRHILSEKGAETHGNALGTCRGDYCNSFLSGHPKTELNQMIQNVAGQEITWLLF